MPFVPVLRFILGKVPLPKGCRAGMDARRTLLADRDDTEPHALHPPVARALAQDTFAGH